MSLEAQINADIKTAMLGKQEVALRALRAVKSAILLVKTEKGGGADLSADDEMKLLQKLVKQRRDSLEIYTTQGRADLAVGEQDELTVIEKYLPKQLSEAEIREELKGILESTGAKTPADMGKVMGIASKHFAGKADNKVVSALIKEMLQ